MKRRHEFFAARVAVGLHTQAGDHEAIPVRFAVQQQLVRMANPPRLAAGEPRVERNARAFAERGIAQLRAAVAGILSQFTVASAGTPFKTGGVLSTTVKVCVTVTVLPQASVAVHVLVMVPQPSTTLMASV